jgi:hypothetical protein
MHTAYIVPAAQWDSMTEQLAYLVAAVKALQAPAPPPDEVLNTAAAAARIGLSADALLRARRKGRIAGIRLNEKDWGFNTSALDKYPRRGHRATA